MKRLLLTFLLIGSFIYSAQIIFPQDELIITVPSSSSIGFKFSMHPMIQQYIAFYQGRGRKTMEMGLFRSSHHEKMIRRIFLEEGVPENLFWINQTEKMWDGALRGPNFPRPLWLFTPNVAKKYGLRKTKYLDETKSFEMATRATAQYLKFLSKKYDENWELAIAAYNSGERNADRAIKKAEVKNYWMAYPYLPRETRNLVPNVLATILIANNPESYGFKNVKKDLPIEYELIRIPPSVSLERIAEYSGTDINFIKQTNPELISNLTPPEPYIVRVPMGSGKIFAQKMRRLLSR